MDQSPSTSEKSKAMHWKHGICWQPLVDVWEDAQRLKKVCSVQNLPILNLTNPKHLEVEA
jgi:hypothetical protein